MKGFAFTIAMMGLIVTLSSVFIFMTLFVLKYHFAVNLDLEYDYNNAQLVVLGLVSSKYNETYSMYRVLSERDSNGFDDDMKGKIEDNLILLTEAKCFRIVNDTATILEKPDCSAVKNVGEIFIARQYNEGELIEHLTLVYE